MFFSANLAAFADPDCDIERISMSGWPTVFQFSVICAMNCLMIAVLGAISICSSTSIFIDSSPELPSGYDRWAFFI
jgi:hypothetical protein